MVCRWTGIGTSGVIPGNAAGMDNRNHVIAIGAKYRF